MLVLWLSGVGVLSLFNVVMALVQGWWSPSNTKLLWLAPLWPASALGGVVLLFIITVFKTLPPSLKRRVDEVGCDVLTR